MSDKGGKTGLSSGASWSLFAENTAFEESDMIVERLGNSANVTRLRPEDITKFGSCPSRESLQITACKECNKLLILSSLQRHYEFKHAKLLSSVKPAPPKRCIPNNVSRSSSTSFSKAKVLKSGSHHKNFIRIEEIDPNEVNVKIEEVPITIPQFEKKPKNTKLNLNKYVHDKQINNSERPNSICSPTTENSNTKGKSSLKKSLQKLKVEKEFEPDKHCGVWLVEIGKNCTRSLTCKTHALSLRRQVPGRSKEFDVLLAEHRARVKSQENSNSNSSSQTLNKTPVQSPLGYEKINFPNISSDFSTTNYNKDTRNNGNLSTINDSQNGNDGSFYTDFISVETLNNSNLPYKQHHPKPLKVNNFGGRRTDCHCALFTRRMDHFRSASASMLARYSCNMTNWKSTKEMSKEKRGLQGLKPAVQDPLQNGIIHKQKGGRKAGLKRHLSLNEVQGLNSGASKRRNSTDINIVDPFTNPNTVQPTSRHNKSLHLSGIGTDQTTSSRKKDFAKSNNLDVSAIDDFLSSNLLNSPSPSDNNILGSIETVDLTKSNTSSNLNLSNPSNTVNITNPTFATFGSAASVNQGGVTSVFTLQPNNNKVISAAPNITITQGMIVSLPNAATVLRNTNMRPNTETTVHSTPSNLTLKQILNKDQNNLLLTISNSNAVSSPAQNNSNTYSISYTSLENQEPAPNVTVTASLSLSGVLQGHAVTTSATKQQFKRMTGKPNNQADNSRLLQQLIIQQQQHNQHEQPRVVVDNTTTTPTIASQATSMQRVVQQQQTQQQNTMTVNATGSQSLKPMPRIHIQQLNQAQQSQQQSQPYITTMQQVNTGFSQQILPKLPTLPQNFNAQNSLQLVTQSTTVAQLQQQTQQHGGALS